MNIPKILLPFGFPNDVAPTKRNIRLWVGKENPNPLKTYSPARAITSTAGVIGLVTWITGLIKKNDTLRKWGGWPTIFVGVLDIACSLIDGTLNALWDQLRGNVVCGKYEKEAKNEKERFTNELLKFYYDNSYSIKPKDLSKIRKIFEKFPEHRKFLDEITSPENTNSERGTNEEVEICLRYLLAIDDKEIVDKLALIAESFSSYNLTAMYVLCDIENTYKDGRTIPHIIKIIEKDKGVLGEVAAESIFHKDFKEYIIQELKSADYKNIDSAVGTILKMDAHECIAKGLMENNELVSQSDVSELLCKILEGKVENEGAKKGIKERFNKGFPINTEIFNRMMGILEKQGVPSVRQKEELIKDHDRRCKYYQETHS